MDNVKSMLLNAIEDLLTNRCTDLNGNMVKYNTNDRDIYIKEFNCIAEKINYEYKNGNYDSVAWEILISVVKKILEMLEMNKI